MCTVILKIGWNPGRIPLYTVIWNVAQGVAKGAPSLT